jgi:hypothetical protein
MTEKELLRKAIKGHNLRHILMHISKKYRISANGFRGNYSFLEVGVRQVFKGGNYSREETIVFLLFGSRNYKRKL